MVACGKGVLKLVAGWAERACMWTHERVQGRVGRASGRRVAARQQAAGCSGGCPRQGLHLVATRVIDRAGVLAEQLRVRDVLGAPQLAPRLRGHLRRGGRRLGGRSGSAGGDGAACAGGGAVRRAPHRIHRRQPLHERGDLLLGEGAELLAHTGLGLLLGCSGGRRWRERWVGAGGPQHVAAARGRGTWPWQTPRRHTHLRQPGVPGAAAPRGPRRGGPACRERCWWLGPFQVRL